MARGHGLRGVQPWVSEQKPHPELETRGSRTPGQQARAVGHGGGGCVARVTAPLCGGQLSREGATVGCVAPHPAPGQGLCQLSRPPGSARWQELASPARPVLESACLLSPRASAPPAPAGDASTFYHGGLAGEGWVHHGESPSTPGLWPPLPNPYLPAVPLPLANP